MTETELRKFCHEKIAMYKNPKYFEIRESLPKTATGKIRKDILKQEERGKRYEEENTSVEMTKAGDGI